MRQQVALLLSLAAAGCAAASSVSPADPARPPPSAVRAASRAEVRWVEETLARLTLREKAGQMVWPQVLGDYVANDSPVWDRQTRLVREEKLGGFIVSVGSPLEIAAKLNALQRMSELPLLIGADLEYGAGFRARGGYFLPNGIDLGGGVVFPPPMAIGATGDPQLAYEMGRVTAIEGRALGIHVGYAPILDVNNNAANPVINTRSFGEDPSRVAAMGVAFIRGMQEHGMLATAKHFPGHGDTDINSHLALPVVNASRARLDSVELVPFRAAVKAGVAAMMTFHGAMPALDSSGVPGTLSPLVLTGLLREELGFGGIIFSDAMDMRGVVDTYGPVEAAMRAVTAGADVLLMPSDARQTIDAVVRGVNDGRYEEARLDRSVRLILEAKARLGLPRYRRVDLDSARAVVGDSEHIAVAARIAERSITLVKDSLRQVPIGGLPRATRVLSLTYARRNDLAAGAAFNAELRRVFPALRVEFVDADAPELNATRLRVLADSADLTIIGSYVSASSTATTVAAPREFVQFVRDLTRAEGGRGGQGAATKQQMIVIAFGNPYLLQQMPEVAAYLIAWGGFPISQRAAARALLGGAPITGRLPIRIPPLALIGAGEMRDLLAAGVRLPGK